MIFAMTWYNLTNTFKRLISTVAVLKLGKQVFGMQYGYILV